MKLSAPAVFGFTGEPVLVLVEEGGTGRPLSGPGGIALRRACERPDGAGPWVALPEELSYVGPGDILRLNPTAQAVRVVYRKQSPHNVLFVTNRCNSRCVMCSQPPTEADDGYLVDDILTMIPWMAPTTRQLGITGGEPTLLGARFVDVVAAVNRHLPATALHVLSNGRLFTAPLSRALGAIGHAGLMVGVPLYSDVAVDHDYVVQARGAFDEAIEGLLHLAAAGIRVEIRVVIHRLTYPRLARLAHFIARNLPFVEQVALMGLEPIGFGKTNLPALWIHPRDYAAELAAAVDALRDAAIFAQIYNHPLCALPEPLHAFARPSISDWKRIFLPACEGCQKRDACGGFFASTESVPAAFRVTPVPFAGPADVTG